MDQHFIDLAAARIGQACRDYRVSSFAELQDVIDANEILIEAWQECNNGDSPDLNNEQHVAMIDKAVDVGNALGQE
jgi:hypothetical protein